ncbi:Spy/CpxP family protein refolding chaperone [Wohlfahrtiimonas larvae]|uniref:CpxP family protein n=1 Tax=Wohlfahrtiimonas larvae TaxID=1157986 RepID=A0ABP9MHI0_9GAMM|nr:Spy/CpxP family protein refolding chaperone [Wohlfahrtiimonas larvae]
MKNKIALTVIAMIALSGSAMAQMHQGNKNHNMDDQAYNHMSQELKLTDEQRAQMKTLHENIRTENQAAREAHRAEMEKFYNNPKFNEDEAKQLAQKQRDDRAVRKMKHRHAMNQILTPEQRAQHSEMMQNHQKNRHMTGKKGEHRMNGGNHNMKHNN